ncbi:MAG: c-type cytochrome [Burkholderiales bacterium]
MFGISKTLAATVVLAALIAPQTDARASGRSGAEVVHQVCAGCHATGKDGAPKIGDEKAWKAREAQGLSSLTEHAITGIRSMPPHGGSLGVTDYELELAITYMVNHSGGHWAVPINKAAPPAAERSGEEIVSATCVKCHGTGLYGAPIIGDRAAWIHRATYGIDALVRSAIRGHGAMPSRGGMPDLSDSELRRAIVYMLGKSVGPANKESTAEAASRPAPGGPVSAQAGWNHKIVEGTDVYLGLVSAADLRAIHPKPDEATAMLGGIPSGRDYYYLNVSLFDSATSAEIRDAKVKATVSDPMMGGETRTLKTIAFNNSVSYGNYIRIPTSAADAYSITLRISRPGTSRTIRAKFDIAR